MNLKVFGKILKNKTILLGLFCCVLSAACAPKQQIVCVYPYEKEAVNVNLNATPDLNKYSGQPHTVVVMLYQLSDPNIFNQMIETPEGLGQLLEGKRFDASALSFRQAVIQPGEKKQVIMDRVEGTRYLGVVGGFYNRQARNFSRLYSMPTKKIKSFFFIEKGCTAKELKMDLSLGSDGFIGGENAETNK